MFDDAEVIVPEDLVFNRVVFVGQQIGQIQLFLFPEVIEDWRVVRRAGVEGPFDGLWRAVVVLHVVGEHHQLGDVEKTPEARIAAAGDDAVALGQHAFTVVGFLDLDEYQRQAVDAACSSDRS